MKKNSKTKNANSTPVDLNPEGCTIGLDVSDQFTQAAVVDQNGVVVLEDRIRTRDSDLRAWLMKRKWSTVVLETGTHSRWMGKLVRECGHELVVADARQLRLIYGGTNKTDRLDAIKLARMARMDRELMHEVELRPEEEQADLAVMIKAREMLVQMRTGSINMVRGMVKARGTRIASCSSEGFPNTAKEVVPADLRNALAPILELIDELSDRIRLYDERIEHLALTKYPEIKSMKQISGVGTLAAMTFRLTIGDGQRFQRSRDVGCYVGLKPKRAQSGERDPQLGITKTGDPQLRKTLVHCAHYILGPFGPDTDLRRWGMKLASAGVGAKKRAIVAVARKLAVLMHRLLVTGDEYEPLRQDRRRQAAVAS